MDKDDDGLYGQGVCEIAEEEYQTVARHTEMNIHYIQQIQAFVKTDIWLIREEAYPLGKRVLYRSLKILLLTLQGFTQDRIQLRASALTFYSLLSIVPVLALGFGIAKGFGFEKALEGIIFEKLEGQEQIATQAVEFSRALLENVKGGLVAGIGVLILLFTVIKILSHIEDAFNDIWYIDGSRSIGRKITDFFSLMLIFPLFFLLSSGLTVFITSSAKLAVERVWLLEAVSPAIFLLLKLLPFCLLWFLFTFLYIFIPNTKVHLSSGILAGILAGTSHQLFQKMYIGFQVGVSKYNAIYGSFAAIPLFFIWMQLSWLIVLLGAKAAFAYQNAGTPPFENEIHVVRNTDRRLLSLRIAHFLIKRFSGEKTAWASNEISRELKIPFHFTAMSLKELEEAGVLSRIDTDGWGNPVYQPARDPSVLTIKHVMDALDQNGSDYPFDTGSETVQKLSESLNVFNELIEKSSANKLLKNI